MKTRNTLLALGLLCAAGPASATILQHNFTLSGPGGITGSGWFTWDDNVVANGDSVSTGGADNTIDYAITLTGGIAGSGVTFTKADCTPDPYLQFAPDFDFDMNFFGCTNGIYSGTGVQEFTFQFSDSTTNVEVVFAPGSTAAAVVEAVPALPFTALGLLAGLLGWTGYRRLKA
ncbi:hypothetical protein E4634_11875 [Mangrovimicrobium sediminis]|uniref:PEP-CTERM sorting domain-containing protein n=1 Tax=Mangrovimicrobium sediminis TaxID=2562682 RepID=A0A4Z0M0T1_9GAMM|nr:hypothetical protein [Haliea sp. SAOS-164]TGD72978.1 hypothetical protein E4634_11875 [Haliea sp. SAOS-164]